MKKMLLMLSVLSVMAGCSALGNPDTKEFTHTGCASGPEIKGLFSDDDNVSTLILKYEGGDLRVTRTMAVMNCSIKKRGMDCNVSLDGNVIHYSVTETDGPTANCLCLVEKMSSVVTGLVIGKEYTFDYFCSHGYPSFSFVFSEKLIHVQVLDN